MYKNYSMDTLGSNILLTNDNYNNEVINDLSAKVKKGRGLKGPNEARDWVGDANGAGKAPAPVPSGRRRAGGAG